MQSPETTAVLEKVWSASLDLRDVSLTGHEASILWTAILDRTKRSLVAMDELAAMTKKRDTLQAALDTIYSASLEAQNADDQSS